MRTVVSPLSGDAENPALLAEAERQYSQGWPDAFTIESSTTALIVVDMQVGFVDPQSELWVPEATRIAPLIGQLIDEFAAQQRLVIFTQATYPAKMPNDMPLYCPPIADGQLATGHPYNAIWPAFEVEGHYVLSSKRSYDAFAGTELDTLLRDAGIETVVIAGTMTNFCCEGTARSAFNLGYHVVVGSDVCASDLVEAHEASLRTLRRGFARVLTAATIIVELNSHAERRTPDSRQR